MYFEIHSQRLLQAGVACGRVLAVMIPESGALYWEPLLPEARFGYQGPLWHYGGSGGGGGLGFRV